MDINNGYDRWLTTPPDEPEAEYCEYCNQEMEYHEDRLNKKTVDIWHKCINPFCPDKFGKYKGGTISVVLDMSEHLAEVEQELADAKNDLKYVRARLANVHSIRERREQTIEELEQKIAELTQSQSNVVVRDTDYQIRRMEDSLECLKECSDWDNFYEEFALVTQEWTEVKKILESYG